MECLKLTWRNLSLLGVLILGYMQVACSPDTNATVDPELATMGAVATGVALTPTLENAPKPSATPDRIATNMQATVGTPVPTATCPPLEVIATSEAAFRELLPDARATLQVKQDRLRECLMTLVP